MISSINKILRTLGIALLSSVITIIMIGGLAYAATGTKLMSNFLSSGVDFISFFSGAADGNIGIDAKSFYARTNGSWLGYPADNRNYLRNDTFMSGTLYDENNSAYYVNPNGTSNLSYVGVGKVQVNDVVTAGAACTATGSVARNASGALLSCQQLKWGRATGNGEGMKGLYSFHAGKGQLYCRSYYAPEYYSDTWAEIDATGTPRIRIFNRDNMSSVDTGWVDATYTGGLYKLVATSTRSSTTASLHPINGLSASYSWGSAGCYVVWNE